MTQEAERAAVSKDLLKADILQVLVILIGSRAKGKTADEDLEGSPERCAAR